MYRGGWTQSGVGGIGIGSKGRTKQSICGGCDMIFLLSPAFHSWLVLMRSCSGPSSMSLVTVSTSSVEPQTKASGFSPHAQCTPGSCKTHSLLSYAQQTANDCLL